jgi:hypothetical protein
VSASDTANILIGILVLGFVLYRQMQPRRIRDNVRLPVILGIIGVVEVVQFLDKHHGPRTFLTLGGSLVLAAVFGALRAATTHVWVEGGQAWRRGNWITAVLWVISLGGHLGYDYVVDGKGPLAGLGSASLLLYLAVTLLIQGLILLARASRLPGAPGAGAGFGSGTGFGSGGGFGSGPGFGSRRHHRRDADYPPPDASYPPQAR